MEESQKIALSHMRDAMEQLGCSSKTFDDATLMRFLKARCMDAHMGAKMFAEWRRWRESFVPFGYPEREVSHQLEGRKTYLAGPSRHGHPILIVQDRKHFLHKDHLQLKKRLAKLYMLQMPRVFVIVWKLVSHFLEKSTLAKVVIVKNEVEKESFLREIGEPNLPEEYGGQAKPVALQDVQLTHWPSSSF